MGKKKFFRGLTAFTLASSLGVSSLVTNHDVVKAETKPKQVKNIIFMIGDGMGVSYLTAHRYMKDNPDTFVVENTTFDDYLIGMQSTNPEDEHQNITDSASAATAMSAGIKTYNAAIAVDNDKTEVKTVLEAAKEKGMSTGLVATSEITHATPAAYGAHDVNRKNMNAIADDYYDELINGQHKIDVMLGGGLKNFIREDRNLVEEFKKDGYSFVTNEDELLKDNNERILGLFAKGGLPKRIDRTEETPDLEEMTREAIERLSKNENGFFLMVEGSQIDWAGHDNDIVAAMSEMEDFEQAFKVALDFAKKDGETLVVLTADHSTGGFSLGANGIYNWFPEPIKAAKRTPDFMAEKIVNGANVRETLKKYIALDLTEEEIKSVEDAAQTKDLRTIDDAIEAIFNTRSVTGWTTGGHTGEDVAVYGYGPQIERFAGKIDNTDHAKIIFDILENKKVNKPKTGQTPADMKEGQFAYNEIQHLISQNVISLDDKGNYYPNKAITRAEAAVMLQRALNLEIPTDLNAFKDVNENHPYAKEIAATKAKGIFKGKADGTFGVNDVLTREQMATILVRAFSLKAQNHVQVRLPDLKSASPAHQENIKILYQNGVTTGRKGGMFDPRSKTKRAEFAVFLYRALKFAIFNADSTIADKPTTFGGTVAEVKKYDQSVIVIAGKDQYIKLANAEVNGNIIIKGNETGAGTVYLENVKVNKVNNQGGVIIVDDVADHSLRQKNVTAEELKINDANGANIVAEEGTKIKTLSLTEKAGATGTIILDSKEKGAYEVVSIGTKGSESSKGVELKGDFSNTKVEVTGEGSQVKVAKDAVVKEIEVKTEAKLEAEQGAKVQAVNLAAEKSGQKIELKGDLKEATVTVKNANAKIEVAKDSVIKEIKKDSSVTGSIEVINNGTVQTAIGVTVKNNPGGQTGSTGNTGSGGTRNPFKLTVMHTNDTHAYLDNIARRITAIKQVRQTNPNSLLLDAGDVFSGTLYFNEFNGLADLEFMNLAGYDAMTFGNHEFDKGTAILANFVKGAKFPFVSANVDFSKDENLKVSFRNEISSNPENGKIYNGIIKEVNGEKIGIFGLTTAETKNISSPGEDVVFEDYIEEAEKAVEAFEAQGVNKIIALTHIGFNDGGGDNDLTLAKEVEGIDVIVGGHSQDKLVKPVVDKTGEEPTIIVQANEYSKYLGTLDVEFDENGKVVGYAGKLIDIDQKVKVGDKEVYVLQDDPKAAAKLKPYNDQIEEKKKTVIGNSAVVLDGVRANVRTKETNLGNLITDGMLAKAKTINPNTIIALQNGGGIRASIDAGEITLAEVQTVMPFGNALAIMKLKGSEIKAALEHSVSLAPASNGAFLHVSGLRFTYDSREPAGNRVKTIEVKEDGTNYVPLEDNKTYFVATNTFIAKGGDGYTMFKKAFEEGRVSEPGFVDWEMFRDYVAAQPNQTVNPSVEGRIIDVATAITSINAADFSGTAQSPKVYKGNVSVDVTGVDKLEYAIVKGDLYLRGNTAIVLNHVTVEGETYFLD